MSTTAKAPTDHAPSRKRRSRRPLVVLAVLAILTAILPNLAVSSAGAAATPRSWEMKLLVLAADGNETDFGAINAFLDHWGIPHDVVLAANTPLTAAMLSDGASKANYQGIVMTTGNLTYHDAGTGQWQSALSTEEWQTLRDFQAKFGVRSVTSYTFPEATYGLSYAGYQDTLGGSLPATLTDAGKAVFSDLNPASPVNLTGAWIYFGQVIDPTVTTPLLTATVGGQSFPIASVTRYPAGWENLAITAANNPNLTHSMLLSTGWINWVTKGTFLGKKYANLDVQIDDLFIEDDVWDPATNTANTSYRTTPQDITALVNYQNLRKADPMTSGFKAEFAFNGIGISSTDPLTQTVVANRTQFRFINHTFSHFNLDCGDCPDPTGVITTTASQIRPEINNNIVTGTGLNLPMEINTMVQPDISGINTPPNPMAQKTSAEEGIRYWIGDTSRAGQGNPTFNTGFATPGDARLYVVPRHPNNLFVAASTPEQWTSVFNYFYAPGGVLCGVTTCFSAPLTYSQILDHEAGYLSRYLLRGDLNPLMFHTPNMRAYDGTHSVLTDLLDRTLQKYKSMVKTPIRTLSFRQAGLYMQDRGKFNASGVSATITECTGITVRTQNAASIPVTGVAYAGTGSSVESYGGRTISHLQMSAGQSVTIPLPPCPTDPGTCASPSTVMLAPVADTDVRQNAPRRNFATGTELSVRSYALGNHRTYLKFSLPTLATGCRITGATLSMNATTAKTGRSYSVQRAGAAWTETGLIWNNQPAATGSSALRTTTTGWNSWDVTEQIAASYPSDYGLVVRDTAESSLTAVKNGFASRESATPPVLVVTVGS